MTHLCHVHDPDAGYAQHRSIEMQHVKEHRAPTRYTLEPGELKALARFMKNKGGISEKQV